jgi:cell division protein FtsI (penicillin-binding protein 3)
MSGLGTNRRLLVLSVSLLVAFGLLVVRAVVVQAVHGAQYRAEAGRQHVQDLTLDAKRGVIYDRNGAELAVSQRMATVYATPFLIEDPAVTAAKLAPLLGVKQSELQAKLAAGGGYVRLARKIDPAIGAQVTKLKLAGVGVQPEDKRVYPRGALAAQLLGFVGTENEGLTGLELQYQGVLTGLPGQRRVVTDPTGRSLDILSDSASQQGSALVLTIDEDIQFEAEQVLADTVKQFGAKKATAVVIDPRNGEVLAMADSPGYDANKFLDATEAERRNIVVTDLYEPGSTFKMVVAAAALEHGLVTKDTVMQVPSTIKVYDRTVHEAETNLPAMRKLTVTQILSESSNVGAVMLGQKVGKTDLVDMIDRFGFTKPLGIDFPGEAGGIMLRPDKWSGSTIANVPIGQGISVTPLQIASAYATIANGGVFVQPHLVRDRGTPQTHRVVSATVAGDLMQMLQVTVDSGTGQNARLQGYAVAGKTGTAQKVNQDGSGYSNTKFISSFVGMVPAQSPRLVILVTVDEPSKGVYYGSDVAAPAFARIADFALKHLEIPPVGGN